MKYIQFILALLFICLLACKSATEYNQADLPTENHINVDGVTFTLSLPKDTFKSIELLKGRFTVINGTSTTLTYYFANIQQLGFELVNAGGIIVLAQPFIVAPTVSSLQLVPGEYKVYSIVSTFVNYDGIRVLPGRYILKAYLLDHNSPELSINLTIR